MCARGPGNGEPGATLYIACSLHMNEPIVLHDFQEWLRLQYYIRSSRDLTGSNSSTTNRQLEADPPLPVLTPPLPQPR